MGRAWRLGSCFGFVDRALDLIVDMFKYPRDDDDDDDDDDEDDDVEDDDDDE